MKLFFPKGHYDKKQRAHVFPLLRPFLKNEGFTDAERQQLYGLSEKDFEFSEKMENADLVLLPMSWNYYLATKQLPKAKALIAEADRLGKKTLIVNSGDFGVRMPVFSNVVVLRTSGYKSRLAPHEFSMPPFISDPLRKYYGSTSVLRREYSNVPVLGFCGQADASLQRAGKENLKTVFRNLAFYLGFSKNEPQQLGSTSYFRAKVLKQLQNSPLVNTNFILRKKYRAGVSEQKEQHQSTREFYDNIRDSDYVICVRGAGNFSVRFYETLALGRVPVLINTDCALPLEQQIDWKKHLVLIEAKEISQAAESLEKFHAQLDVEKLNALFEKNRNLWESHLTLKGFFKEFFLFLDQKNGQPKK